MLSTYTPGTSRSTRLDASQGITAPLTAPFDIEQRTVHAGMYPLSGSSLDPPASNPNATPPTFSPPVPGVYGAGWVYDGVPNYQGYSTVGSGGFVVHPTATSTTPLPLEATPYYNPQFTFQYPFRGEPEATLDQPQTWHHHQVALEEVYRVDAYQNGEQSLTTLAVPEAPSVVYNHHQHQSHPAEETMLVNMHTCFNNSQTSCSGRGDRSLDLLFAFVEAYPNALSPKQYIDCAVSALLVAPDAAESSVQASLVDTTAIDPSIPQYGPTGWETAFSSSNSPPSASTSTSAYPSPSESDLYTPNQFSAAPSPMGSTSSSVRKRELPADVPERRRKKRRVECTDMNQSSSVDNPILDCGKKPRKKRPLVDGQYYCRLCLMLQKEDARPLSRKDALKRHVQLVHWIFRAVFGHEEFDVLKPVRNGECENLRQLIAFCIPLQLMAQQQGKVIPAKEDLTLLYPDIAASLNRS